MNQMVLNTIVAESVDAISDKLDAMPGDINANLQKLLQRLIRAHKRVLFSGDAVKYGSRYDNWQQWNGSPAVTNYMFAMIPGNKEYYYTGSNTFYDY